MRKVLYFLIISLMIHIYPTTSSASGESPPELASETAILMDASSGTTLVKKQSSQQMYPASITKIATAILAIEEGDLDAIVTVSDRARNVDGTRVYLEAGEQVPLRKLVNGMMINSGNDAAIAIAEYMDGSVEAFAEHMNEFLRKKVKVHHTTFQNPHGLFDAEHFTTARDMALITKYALKNPTFREIFGTKEFPWDGESWDTTLINHNRLLWDYEGATGGKNGYVSQSGHTLVTTAKHGNTELIAIVMKAPSKRQSYKDTVALLDYGFEHFQTNTIAGGSVFSDAKGTEFITHKPLFYTSKVNEQATTKVNRFHEVVVKGADGRELLRSKLTKKEPDVAASSENDSATNQSTKEETDAITGSVLKYSFMIGTIFVVIAYFMIRKRQQWTV